MTERHPFQEPDELPWRVLAGVMAATTVLSFALGGWGCALARRLGPALDGPVPDAVDPVDLVRSSLDHELFDAEPSGAQRRRAADVRRLQSWGWVDRERGIVHVPIDVAMRLHLEASSATREAALR